MVADEWADAALIGSLLNSTDDSTLDIDEGNYTLLFPHLPEDAHDVLESNRNARSEILHTHLMPTIVIAVVVYILIGSLWLFYNIRTYRKQKAISEQKRSLEAKIRLERYHGIPLDFSRAIHLPPMVEDSDDEIELITHVPVRETVNYR